MGQFHFSNAVSRLNQLGLTHKIVGNEIKIRQCPYCSGDTSKLDNQWKLYISATSGAYFCHRCNAKGAWRDFVGSGETEDGRPQIQSQVDRKKYWKGIWNEASELMHSSTNPAVCYLASRGLSVSQLPRSLKIHPYLAYYDDSLPVKNYPTLVGIITDSAGNELGIHRHYLTPEGNKAEVPTPKKTLGKIKGGAVYFDALGEVLNVGEGVETMLAVREATKLPTCSALTAGGLENFVIPKPVTELRIWGDLDRSGRGQEAALKLATRAAKEGVKVFVHLPGGPIAKGTKGVDWLDIWNQVGSKAFEEQIRGTGPHTVDLDFKDPPKGLRFLASQYLKDRKYLSAAGSLLRFYQDDFYRWDERRYYRTETKELLVDVANWLQGIPEIGDDFGEKTIRNILLHIKGLTRIPAATPIPGWLGKSRSTKFLIPMENGILDLHQLVSGENPAFLPHTSNYFCTYNLPYAYDSSALCPLWLKLLEDIQPIASIRALLQEWFGYLLIPECTQEKFMLWIGEGANGKSLCLNVLRQMIGAANVSAISLEAFDPMNRFALAHTVGKLANIVEELSEIKKVSEGELKKYVTGQLMTAERKHKPHFDFYPTARLTISTNTLPPFVDQSNGLWRRMISVPFSTKVPEERQNKKYIDPNFWQQSGELPGILNWAIEGLARLLKRGSFDIPSECSSLLEEIRVESNPAKEYLALSCIPIGDGSISCRELYFEYRAWCEAGGNRPLNEANFGREVKRIFPQAEKVGPVRIPGTSRRYRKWMGISLLR